MVQRRVGRLNLSRRWFSPRIVFIALFALVWDAFLVFWYAVALSSSFSQSPVGTIALLFPLIHVAVGIGLTYYALCGFFNSTTIEVSDPTISVRHGPLPWPGHQKLHVNEMDQLWSVRKSGGRSDRGYTVKVKLRSGRSVDLVRGLQAPEEALFIEQAVQKHLRIKDRPEPGELPR